MKCPTLHELPPPPTGKTGWPWTEETPSAPPMLTDEKPWPRISIITPSYNQGRFIEETIRSVLLQGYPDLEYFIMDGGSTDESAEIIRKYKRWLSGWVSEKDRGQSHAINKGLSRSSGEVWTWLCSDDQFAEGALNAVGQAWLAQTPHILVGRGDYLHPETRALLESRPPKPARCPADILFGRGSMLQPACFFNTALTRQIGCLREDLHFVMDCYFYMKQMATEGRDFKAGVVDKLLATSLLHPECKTVKHRTKYRAELEKVLPEFLPYFSWLDRRRVAWAHIKQRTVDRVTETMNLRPGSRPALLALPLRHPFVLGANTYYRALRDPNAAGKNLNNG